jgi:RsmE family RNA methyltransferase
MRLTVAVAPPRSVERTRFLVEKLGELGADRLLWLHTHHGHARLPNSERVRSWARSALEQSRGAWLMETHDGLVESSELEGTILVADPSGPPLRQVAGDVTLAVGPEGGLDAGEVRGTPWSLGPRILRVETAAIVGAALLRMKHHAEG